MKIKIGAPPGAVPLGDLSQAGVGEGLYPRDRVPPVHVHCRVGVPPYAAGGYTDTASARVPPK